jgi:hypothetical protein
MRRTARSFSVATKIPFLLLFSQHSALFCRGQAGCYQVFQGEQPEMENFLASPAALAYKATRA